MIRTPLDGRIIAGLVHPLLRPWSDLRKRPRMDADVHLASRSISSPSITALNPPLRLGKVSTMCSAATLR